MTFRPDQIIKRVKMGYKAQDFKHESDPSNEQVKSGQPIYNLELFCAKTEPAYLRSVMGQVGRLGHKLPSLALG